MKRDKILVVEDEKGLREILTEMLSTYLSKKVIKGFSNGRNAWEYIEKEPYSIQLVITDWDMPQMNGIELTKRIKALSLEIPVILMSGNLPPENNSANEFLQKPILRIEQLLDLVKKLIS